MPLGKFEISRIAQLSRLKITLEEEGRFSSDFEAIINSFKQLKDVDTSSVKSDSKCISFKELREDIITDSLSRSVVLKNVPESDGSFIIVPKVIG